MAIPTFYHAPLCLADRQISLCPDEAQHAHSARRLRVGSNVQIINGLGLRAQAQIAEIGRNKCLVSIDKIDTVPPPDCQITVATAIPKGDRQRFLVECLTQLGVAAIVPLDCEHSATFSDHKNVSKWPRYAIEAAKQSQNAWLPKILSGCSPHQLLMHTQVDKAASRWVADAVGRPISDTHRVPCLHLVVIGPEAGFTTSETMYFSDQEFIRLRLGAHILRTETAAIVAAGSLLRDHS